jgi:hypothetical protein
VITGADSHIHRFYEAELGGDDLILGYPWLASTNPRIDWTKGTIEQEVSIRTPETSLLQPTPSVHIAGLQVALPPREPLLEPGDELIMRLCKVTVSQRIAEEAQPTNKRTWDQIVPMHYHRF